jgi:hypothetical protein
MRPEDIAEVRQLYKRTKRAIGGSADNHPDQGYAPKPAGILDVDNPGGDWLKENREYSESKGYLPSGAPKSFGKVTAVWRKPKSNDTAPVYLPVSMLAKLPGVMSEQQNVRSNDLDWLVDNMGKTGKLPKIDDREYKPFITVDHRGMPFVSEGNHRIMAAAKLGWDYLPVEVRYFNGAESVDGPLHPDRIREMHAPQKAKGGATINTPVLDKDKAIRRALRIAKQEGGPLSGGMQPRGLEFPPEDAAFRLRTKLNREAKVAAGKEDPGLPSNPRMTIRAPEAEEGGNQLPDFVVGPVTPQDWIDRHEKILSPDEITHASNWYKNIYGNFLQYTNNDEAQAKPLMRAWLVAQQNVSPAGAMQNVLLQKEQMQRGVPEKMWRAGGMPNPTNAARAVLQDKPIAGGVGQKISDFVDSAEGLDTRSFLGHDQKGGKPFVIDVHSARDTGLVDPALLNHLRGLGYNEEDLAKVQTDFEASPSDAQYENRAQWGRDLTDHLNGIKWQGKSDWRPEEIQAVGWMGMTKLTRNAEEDSASGLARNLRRVSFELAPGEGSPWAAKYGEAFSTLPDDERALITQTMGGRAMEIANELAQTHAVNTVYGTGAWQQYQNPAAVAQVLATEQGADILAHSIGHLLHQTEVWHNRAKPMTANPKGFAIDFIEQGSNNLADRGQLQDFWTKIMDADKTGLIQGYQPITLPSGETGVRVLVDKGGKKTSENLFKALSEGGELNTTLNSLPYKVQAQLAEAEISKARNDWKENPNGELYIQGLRDILGSDPSARLGAAGSQLEKELEALLDQAYTRQGRAWRSAQGPEEGQVTATKPKKPRAKAKESPEPTAGMASGGIVDRALKVAAQARRH